MNRSEVGGASLRKTIVITLMSSCLLMSSTGCIGSFALTKNVHKFNLEASEHKVVDELIFLAFIFLPVYGFATLIDAIVINTIEFWTDKNPMSTSDTKVIETDEGIAELQHLDANTVQVTLTGDDGTTQIFTLVRGSDGVKALDGQGGMLAHVATHDGQPCLMSKSE